ncbi:MAG: hypothetical protein ACK56I_09870, partial [bacterium]
RQPVQFGHPVGLEADEAHRQRLSQTLEGESGVERIVELDPHDARDGLEPRPQRERRTPCAGEDVGETRVPVVVVARLGQRGVHAELRDEAADATGHHQRDAEHLTAQLAQIARQLEPQR